MRRFNLAAPQSSQPSELDAHPCPGASVGEAIGAEQMSASLHALADGERSHPYHFHHGLEEWLLVVAGSPLLRTPEGERVLRAGDVICFPAGPAGAHQVSGPGTVLIVAENRTPDAIEYPDSGRIGLFPPGKVFRTGDAVDGWDGA